MKYEIQDVKKDLFDWVVKQVLGKSNNVTTSTGGITDKQVLTKKKMTIEDLAKIVADGFVEAARDRVDMKRDITHIQLSPESLKNSRQVIKK